MQIQTFFAAGPEDGEIGIVRRGAIRHGNQGERTPGIGGMGENGVRFAVETYVGMRRNLREDDRRGLAAHGFDAPEVSDQYKDEEKRFHGA